MASPQTENGYTRIANELLDALCRIRISGEAYQVFQAILRKTYGYGKKEDEIALSQFCDLTGLKKNTICKAIGKLLDMNLITKKENGKDSNIYTINKDFDAWKPLPKKGNVTQKEKASLPKKGHTKENTTKERTTNVVPAKQRIPEIDFLVDYLKSKLGSEKLDGSIKQNRNYAWLCIKKFGPDPPNMAEAYERTKKVINLAFRDSFHAARSTDFKYIYYNGMKIVATAKEKLNKKEEKENNYIL